MLAFVLAIAVSGFQDLPLVEQEVECISVAHFYGDAQVMFFWDTIQGEPALLSAKWHDRNMQLSCDGERWVLSWKDDNDDCYRVIRTKCFVESWEDGNPVNEKINGRAWFDWQTIPGLKRPPAKK